MRAPRWRGVLLAGAQDLTPTPTPASHQVDAVDKAEQTALHCACLPYEDGAAAQAVVLLLLQPRARVDVRDAAGETPLHIVARHGCFEIMRLLLDHGAEVDARDRDAWTPLVSLLRCCGDWCCDEDSEGAVTKCVQVLAGRGADVNAVDSDGRTPLYHAVAAGHDHPDAIHALLAAGARAEQDTGPVLIDKLLDVTDPEPPDAETISALLAAGAGASFETVSRLAEAALDGIPLSEEAEGYMTAILGTLAAAQRALDEDVDARVSAGLAAAVEADRRDVASGLRALITGAAAERRRLEAAREAMVEERRAAAVEREAAAQERRAAAAERAELLRLRAEVAALAGGGGAATAAEGAGGGGGCEAGPVVKRAKGG
jgi:uncharacterized protein